MAVGGGWRGSPAGSPKVREPPPKRIRNALTHKSHTTTLASLAPTHPTRRPTSSSDCDKMADEAVMAHAGEEAATAQADEAPSADEAASAQADEAATAQAVGDIALATFIAVAGMGAPRRAALMPGLHAMMRRAAEIQNAAADTDGSDADADAADGEDEDGEDEADAEAD